MTDLNDAADALLRLLERNVGAAHTGLQNAFYAILPSGDWTIETKGAVVAGLVEVYPHALRGAIDMAAEMVAAWYDALAPDEPYSATVPDEIVTDERIAESIGWAIRTATTAETALAQLAGSVQRAVLDAQRATVAHNAAAEGVRYRRHTNYAGACDWCLVMATRGAIYTSTASAVRGHDNCRCIAVPERSGSSYETPAMVLDAEARYAEARRQLEAEGSPTSLDAIVKRMDAMSIQQQVSA